MWCVCVLREIWLQGRWDMCWWRCEPREKRLNKICGIFKMVPSPNLCIDIFFLRLSAQHTPLSTGLVVVVVVKH